MATQIKLRRDTAANWDFYNPILALGEPGYDTTNNKIKVGDGTSTWAQLVYLTDVSGGGTGNFTFDTNTITNSNGITLHTVGTDQWTFGIDGSISLPGDIKQGYQDNTTCSAGVDTVIYTSTSSNQHAIKLFVMVEGTPDGGTSWETQACDIIAVRGFVNDIVHVTAYGVTYSSGSALATFDGQWNATSNRIEITCTPTSGTNNVVASVHAIEMTTND